MSICTRAQDLFGAYWDDETTQAEREWLEGHFTACSHCRESYEQLARTLEAVAELPRAEVAPGLAERALAAARRLHPAPDRIFVRETPAWIPVTAAVAAGLLIVFTMLPMLTQRDPAGQSASNPLPVHEPRLVTPAGQQVAVATSPAPSPATPVTGAAGHAPKVAAPESLFDHTEDMDFVLDPVQLRRGRAHTVHLPSGVQGEQAVISY